MKFYVGVTDNRWFNYLRTINPEDINFWQPGGKTAFKVLTPGAPFLFKLKSPINAIGGVGFFVSHTFLPLSIAWDTFGIRNGCETFTELQSMILNYRQDRIDSNPTIGCIVLTNPIFFEPQEWIKVPVDWSNSIVQGKSYSAEDPLGQKLWLQVEELIMQRFANQLQIIKPNQLAVAENDAPMYGKPVLTNIRLGQGAFRVLVTDAYNRRCAVTGEKTLPVLEAAHIKPYASSGPHLISNALLLRSDIHKLFDTGYITITDSMNVEVSKRIREEYQNGKEYYRFHESKLVSFPETEINRPDLIYLDWHNQHIFKP